MTHDTPIDDISRLHLDEYLSSRAVEGGLDLLVFAHGAFIKASDAKLSEFGLGRAHFRFLHLVARRPHIAIGDLVEALQISKQSVNRVNCDLLSSALIEHTFCSRDRRRRLVSLTDKGNSVVKEVSLALTFHISRAYSMVGPEAVQGFWLLMQHLVPFESRQCLQVIDRDPSQNG